MILEACSQLVESGVDASAVLLLVTQLCVEQMPCVNTNLITWLYKRISTHIIGEPNLRQWDNVLECTEEPMHFDNSVLKSLNNLLLRFTEVGSSQWYTRALC
jgi:hypothetical protein